jgi:hypothetical protein|tara:strand:+ start:4772 stop:5614 length:843 start_codon:yes stop_codon:yes gene_type:complete
MSEIRSGSNNDLTTGRYFDPNCLNAFLEELGDDITGACMVPINLPQKEIINIIKRAKKWFYKKYEYSVKENYYHIPHSIFSTDYFKSRRTLNLPGPSLDGGGGVYSVYGLYDLQSGWNGGGGGMDVRFDSGSDFSMDRMLFRGMYEGGGMSEAAEELQYYVLNASMQDLTRQILNNPISYSYSNLTGELKFMGDTPKGDVILELYETIPDCALYSDEIFFRYVSAKVKQSIGSKLAIFKFALPGNVDFDYDAIKSMGDDELSAIDEEIKGDEGVDWMMHS